MQHNLGYKTRSEKSLLHSYFLWRSPTTSLAEDSIRPGLWEISTTSDFLARVLYIPSQHMQQIASLARQYGLEKPQIQNGIAALRICITQEIAKQETPPISMAINLIVQSKMPSGVETATQCTWYAQTYSFRETVSLKKLYRP